MNGSSQVVAGVIVVMVKWWRSHQFIGMGIKHHLRLHEQAMNLLMQALPHNNIGRGTCAKENTLYRKKHYV